MERPPESRALAVHRALPGYAPTPLVSCSHTAAALGVATVLAKDESLRFGLPAFKMLGVTYAARAAVEAAGPGAQTLVAATDGNHGRALARVAAELGLAARIHVPRGLDPGRVAAIAAEGAEVVVEDGSYDDAVRASGASLGVGDVLVSDTAWKGYEEIPRLVVEGYRTLFVEVAEAALATPTHVVIQAGVGGLAAAAVLEFATSPARLVTVEAIDADCVLASLVAGAPVTVPGPHRSRMEGLNAGEVSLVAWPLLRARVDAALAISDDPLARGEALLRADGLDPGPCGAAGVAALGALDVAQRETIGLGPASVVLTVVTEGRAAVG
ncbi:MAG: pyridoxal-phosphate dependent enzyme [Thermoleophilia bacterium]|nr:pyridoxal-phosphate dependent enzyme [Thermoleophilia bacterium]